MCGIAGIWSGAGASPPEHESLRAMIHALRHRGPDGFGYHLDASAGIGLAHARLGIIDLATGHQPIRNEDGSVQVVFNGEIFNYVELRAELLARGHRLYTTSDTEVIVHLYEEFGDDFVHRLNGQFAIALWDRTARRLVLARDRVGIRPLHYARSKSRLLFASEAKALFAEGSLVPQLDLQSLRQAFTYWAPLESRSAFAGVSSLPPGCLLVADANGERVRRYWDWDFAGAETARSRPLDDYAEELRALLEDSVRLQLRADVPVGTYLSGGLDSSAVTALAQRLNGAPVEAFSLTFEDPEFDESEHQRAVAARLGISCRSVRCRREDVAALLPRAVWHAEAPILRTAPVPLMQLSGAVREAGYKVVLTGEGADEVFAGYDLFREAKIRRWIERHPDSRWRSRLLERLYPWLRTSPVRAGAFARQFFSQGAGQSQRAGYAHLPRWTTTSRSLQFLSPAVRDRIASADPMQEIEAGLPPAFAGWPALGRDQYVEAHTLMSGYLLSAQGDRVAMANSVEGRFPYLDHRLIEFACRLPPSVKLAGLREKAVLKRAVRDLLPEAVLARPKQPYRAPDVASFVVAGRLRDEAAELLSAPRLAEAGYFDPAAVGRLVEKCVAGRAVGFGDNMAFVGILSTMLLHEAFVRARPPRPLAAEA